MTGKEKNSTPEKTFIIDIKNTQNHTWQGTATWTQKQKKVAFRSTLELIRLLDSAAGTRESKEMDWEKP